MKARTVITGLGALAAAGSLAAGGALTAAAASPTPSPGSASPPAHGPCTGSEATVLACIRARSAVAIAEREAALQKMETDLERSGYITASDRSALLGQVQSDETGLTALGVTIENDTTVAQAHHDAMTIVTGYRVYVLEGPKVHLVIAADTEERVESTLQSLLPEVQTAINNSSAPASQKAAAQASLDNCSARLSAAESASSGVSTAVIGLEPSGYPANEASLVAARSSVGSARSDLRDCRTDLLSIRTDLGH